LPPGSSALGQVSLQFNGTMKPQVGITSGQVSVVGEAGASITNLSLNPLPVYGNSYVAYGVLTASGYLLYSGPYLSASPYVIGGELSQPQYPSFSHTGLMAFSATPKGGSYSQIYYCYLDGSKPTQITTASVNHLWSAWSPNSTTLAVAEDNGHIVTIPYSGGTETTILGTGSNPTNLSYSPDGSKVVYDDYIISASGDEILSIPSTGGNATFLSNVNFNWPQYSPDGNWILCVDAAKNVALLDPSGSKNYRDISDSSSSMELVDPIWAPDNAQFLMSDTQSSVSILQHAAIGENAPLSTYPFPAGISSGGATPAWSPFFERYEFAGTGRPMGTTASGFLYSQVGSAFGSLVTFQSTTAGSTSVTAETPSGSGAAIVFQISADNLISLYYTNCYAGAKPEVVLGTPDALVSFDPTTGLVTMVAPFIQGRGNAKPLVQCNSATEVLTANFTAVYGLKGEKLSSTSAARIVLDRKTGRVLSVN